MRRPLISLIRPQAEKTRPAAGVVARRLCRRPRHALGSRVPPPGRRVGVCIRVISARKNSALGDLIGGNTDSNFTILSVGLAVGKRPCRHSRKSSCIVGDHGGRLNRRKIVLLENPDAPPMPFTIE
jgi:hypothetical protein